MKIYIQRFFWGFLSCLCTWATIQAQTDFNFKAGMECWSFKDEKEQAGQSMHSGQFFGFDVIVENDKLLFAPGFHYHRISVIEEENCYNFNLSEAHHVHYITIPLVAGYRVLDGSDVDASLLGGVEVNFFYDLDENDVGLDDDMWYGVIPALSGIGYLEFFNRITLETRYHFALHPSLKIRDDSELRGWTFALGVKI